MPLNCSILSLNARVGPWHSKFTLCAAICIALLVALGSPSVCCGVTFESPEVKAVVDKGLKYLEGNTQPLMGGKCLSALAFLKNGHSTNHPRVQEALAACKTEVITGDINTYSLGLALIFMCEAFPEEQRPLIQSYLDVVLKRQKANGGWGYVAGTHAATGDISQTQYAVLGLWMAHQHGFDVPIQAIENVANYLIRVQDPKGSWGYQGIDPGNYERVTQEIPSASLTAAGLGSLLIIGDLVELPRATSTPKQSEDMEQKLPAALVAVDKPKFQPRKRRRANIDVAMYKRAVNDGNAWFAQTFELPVTSWTHYYMYSYERYRSYRELFEEKPEPEPRWYTLGFEYLRSTQTAEGAWMGTAGYPVDTAFSVLFLSRSSQKAIGATHRDFGEGVLRGGLGLPQSTADIREVNGQLTETALAGSVDELLALMEDESNPDIAALAETAQTVRLDPDITKRTGQIERLRGLVRAESPESRLVAVRSLASDRDLANVPVLLYALTDPDLRVVLEADKALRFISRKIDGVGIEAGADRDRVKQGKAAWTEWLLSIRPDAQLLE